MGFTGTGLTGAVLGTATGGVPRECVYDNLRSAVARRERDIVTWNPRFVQLRGNYAHATDQPVHLRTAVDRVRARA